MSTETVTFLPDVTHTTEPATDAVQAAQVRPDRREATVWELACIVAGSRDFPDCRTPEKAAVRILAGLELGIGPIASVDGIRVENGKIAVSAAIMESIVDRSPVYDWKLIERNSQHCAIEFFRNGQSRGVIDYTMADAGAAQLLNKKGDIWKKHTASMLFAAAFRTGARAFCAGAFNGQAVYEYEELGYAVDEEGRVIESQQGVGGELCTRDQRQQIVALVEAVGDSMPGYLENLGIKLLDELTQGEAAKEIKRLEKRLLKAGKPAETAAAVADNPTSDVAPPATQRLTAAQQTLADAVDESRQPSTPDQRDAILGLAQWLMPDEDECREVLVAALVKRSCRKLAELTHLQAAALIESLQARIKEYGPGKGEPSQPPFDPDPARLPGM